MLTLSYTTLRAAHHDREVSTSMSAIVESFFDYSGRKEEATDSGLPISSIVVMIVSLLRH